MRRLAPIALALCYACSSDGPVGLPDGVAVFDQGLADDAMPGDLGFAPDADPSDAGFEDAPLADLGFAPDADPAPDALAEDALPPDADPADGEPADGDPADVDPADAPPADAPDPDAAAPDALPYDGGPGDAGACPNPTDVCTQCVSTFCTAQYCGCYDTTDCPSLVLCVAQCTFGDLICAQNCWTAFPAGISDGFLLGDCSTQFCSGLCPPAPTLTPCSRCSFAQCELDMNNCLAVPVCSALINCVTNCAGNAACRTQCYNTYPQGSALGQAVESCVATRCVGQCP
jgi:hypothetical protein